MDHHIETFISQLYRSTSDIELGHFRQWALEGLRNQIAFDAAIWSSGHLSTRRFHIHTIIGLPSDYPERLLQALPINPISKVLFAHPEQPVDMADVVDDAAFYQSEIYQELFGPLGIERILSSIHIENRSGLFTLLTLYRSDRNARFTADEKARHQRLLFHLLQAASHARLNNLKQINYSNQTTLSYAAICDQHGIYHEVESGFLDLIEECFPQAKQQALPFDIPEEGSKQLLNGVCIQSERLGDLWRIGIRPAQAVDQLTDRELEVVHAVTQGLSFKQAAKEMNLSPSTVSNHLYRVYQKLGINNRSELADLLR
ncbi:MAG: LuxR C-terminal-related transcriptional regulator [Oleiphilaceae bacterium]|nr:LuxR C-terminal-related transcriptional regulator [Oleiphilaceae bacterium]